MQFYYIHFQTHQLSENKGMTVDMEYAENYGNSFYGISHMLDILNLWKVWLPILGLVVGLVTMIISLVLFSSL